MASKLFKILMSAWLVMAPILISMCAPVTAHSQAATFPTQPQCTVVLPATAATASTQWIDLSTPQCQDTHYFTLTFYAIGTVSTCQMKSQQAQDSIGTGAVDLIANQTCTSTGVTSTSALLAAGNTFVNINLGTKTGAGTVLGILNGYRQNPYGTVNISGAVTTTACTSATCSETVFQPTGSNLHIMVDSGTLSGVTIITGCGTSTEIQGNAVVTSTATSNLTFTMADGTTFTAKSGNRIEIHSYQTVNTGATNALITFTMDSNTPVTLGYGVAPTSTTPFGGSNVGMPTPLFTTVQNKAMSIQAGGSSTSIYVSVQGCVVP